MSDFSAFFEKVNELKESFREEGCTIADVEEFKEIMLEDEDCCIEEEDDYEMTFVVKYELPQELKCKANYIKDKITEEDMEILNKEIKDVKDIIKSEIGEKEYNNLTIDELENKIKEEFSKELINDIAYESTCNEYLFKNMEDMDVEYLTPSYIVDITPEYLEQFLEIDKETLEYKGGKLGLWFFGMEPFDIDERTGKRLVDQVKELMTRRRMEKGEDD